MRVLLVSHPSSMEHDTGVGHPERPARIPAVLDGVRGSGLEIVEFSPPEATLEILALVHEPAYVKAIEHFCAAGGGALDPDTVARPRSWEAALRSAASGPAAVEALRRGAADIAFLAMRPPGHHAMPARAMGFCLFNNIAITAAHLASEGNRVAIVDFDVHHGNSTQDVFYENPNVLYISMHEFPAYPGTGWLHERGTGEGEGMTINVPWPTATDGVPYRWAFDRVVVAVLAQYAPDWLLVSAGYDAHVSDPLAGIRLVEADYQFMGGRLSRAVGAQRTVLFLEGGYDLAALQQSSAATMRGFAEGPLEETPALPVGGPAAEVAHGVAREAALSWDL